MRETVKIGRNDIYWTQNFSNESVQQDTSLKDSFSKNDQLRRLKQKIEERKEKQRETFEIRRNGLHR